MPTSFGIACLGITHPHVSVRLDVARRIDGIRLVGVADPDPANQDRLQALSAFVEAPILTRDDVLASADVHGVIVEPWTYEMVDGIGGDLRRARLRSTLARRRDEQGRRSGADCTSCAKSR